ncbi:MFS transporter [Nocardiopsis lucentensis]|uniref:MFS transporter n=1 Tax=Nocardiopsis lucentensis TaxID=53441 RepID=UPI0003492CB9|nr:MFS transporter [Nocardiopsis lucentensis]
MATSNPRTATWREWLGLAVLTLPLLMSATDMTVLFLALPSIAADLAPSSTQLLWILHVASFLQVGVVLTMGWLGPRMGHRRLLTAGVTVYGLSSLVAAFSVDPLMLIATRAVMGMAAASLLPSITSLLRVMFTDTRQFSAAIAVVMSSFSAGMAIGPPLGGALLEYFSWGSVFLINVPVAVLLLLFTPLLPRVDGVRAQRLDLLGVAFSVLAVIAVIFGLQELADDMASGSEAPMWPYLVCVAAGLALGALFVRRQLRAPEPLLDLRLFSTPAFSVSLVAMLLMLLGVGGSDMLLAQYLQAVEGMSPGRAGLLLIAPALGSIVGGLLPTVLNRWARPGFVMGVALLVAGAGAVAMVWFVGEGTLPGIVVAAVVIQLAIGPLFTLSYNLIIASAPMRKAGSAAAMGDVAGGFGNALSLAFLGSLAAVVYRRLLDDADLGAVPAGAVESAGESVGGATAVARTLPGPIATELLEAARSAFTTAVQTGYGFTAAVLVPVGLVVLWALRRVRLENLGGDGEPEAADGTPGPGAPDSADGASGSLEKDTDATVSGCDDEGAGEREPQGA